MPDMKRYERAEMWVDMRLHIFSRQYPCAYVYINADDLTYCIAKDYDAASKLYQAMYGPTPVEGRYMLGVQLQPPEGVCTSCGQILPLENGANFCVVSRLRAWLASTAPMRWLGRTYTQ